MQTKTLMTAKEFETVCENLGSSELIRGEVIQLSPAGSRHSQVTANIAILIGTWARQTGLGRVYVGEAGLIIEHDPDTVRGADVAYGSYERHPRGSVPTGFGTTPPELVVEVVGKGQGWRDMVEKAGEYMRMGVDRVWVVDPKTQRVHVFRSDAAPEAFSGGDTLADEAILPGFSCTVDDFFED